MNTNYDNEKNVKSNQKTFCYRTELSIKKGVSPGGKRKEKTENETG